MVSIVLPVYQVEDYIGKCLRTLLAQTYRDIEIICVNDCTMDNSITVIKEYQKQDTRIRLVHHKENRGLGGARNTGIDYARGEYVIFVDSDDYVSEQMVEKLYYAASHTKSDAAVCGMMLVLPEHNLFQQHSAFIYEQLAEEKIYQVKREKRVLTDMWPSACNKIFKMSVIRQNKIRFKEQVFYEDHTFFYEYFSCCETFIYIREPLYYYRKQRQGSITTQPSGREAEIFVILKYLRVLFKKMYGTDARELFVKIAVRLLYERRWVFQETDKNYYKYLRQVSRYLGKWEQDYLWSVKDGFIEQSDPVFYDQKKICRMEWINTKCRLLKPVICVRRAILRRIK